MALQAFTLRNVQNVLPLLSKCFVPLLAGHVSSAVNCVLVAFCTAAGWLHGVFWRPYPRVSGHSRSSRAAAPGCAGYQGEQQCSQQQQLFRTYQVISRAAVLEARMGVTAAAEATVMAGWQRARPGAVSDWSGQNVMTAAVCELV